MSRSGEIHKSAQDYQITHDSPLNYNPSCDLRESQDTKQNFYRKERNMYRYIGTNGLTYKLCETSITLRGGREAKVYYFIGEDIEPRKGSHYANDLPKGFEIVEAPQSGHPLVVKSRN